MKIAFVSDLHIDTAGALPLSIDTRLQYQKTLEYIEKEGYKVLILGGDLCHRQGDPDIYRWIHQQLNGRFEKVLAIPGNHDNPVMLAQAFGLSAEVHYGELYYSRVLADTRILFLDTSSGQLSSDQWSWLDAMIADSSKHVIIVMHHPPIEADSRHMEPKYQFAGMEDMRQLALRYSHKIFHVFCGHYHLDRTVVSDNLVVHISPSVFVQIHPESKEFLKGSEYYGFREINLLGNGSYSTGCITVGSLHTAP